MPFDMHVPPNISHAISTSSPAYRRAPQETGAPWGKTGGQINQVKFAAFEVGAALAESPGRWTVA